MLFQMGELFCGPGGLACGALHANVEGHPELRIEHAWANDYDEAPQAKPPGPQNNAPI